MKVTKAMVDDACAVYRGHVGSHETSIRLALEAALTDVPDVPIAIIYDPKSPPSAEFPFRLTAKEEGAMDRLVSGMDVVECMQALRGAVRRALATLAAPKLEPLSEGEELVLAYVEKYDAPKDAHVNELVKAMRIRFPKPEKTPGQVFFEAMHPEVRWAHCMNKEQVERAVQAAVDHTKGKP